MAECERVPGCIFFHDRMTDLPFAAEVLKQKFCLGSNIDCARHMIFDALGKEYVPTDLYPNDVSRAERILADAQFEDAGPQGAAGSDAATAILDDV
jgi:hypothetical protein